MAKRSGEGKAWLLEMPRRKDGAPLLMLASASFLQRLIRDRVEVKGCVESDVSSSHMDLRHLTVEQLVAIRVNNIGFSTASESHAAHVHFLESMDAHLCDKLARRLLRGWAGPPPQPSALRVLGCRAVLALGAADLLATGWGGSILPYSATARAAAMSEEVWQGELPPPHWGLELDGALWAGRTAALFHTTELWLEVPGGEPSAQEAWAAAAGGAPVALVADCSSGAGPTKRLQWEIAVVDPAKCDVVAALALLDPKLVQSHQHGLKEELQEVLVQRGGVDHVPRPLRSPRSAALAARARAASPRPACLGPPRLAAQHEQEQKGER